MIQKIKDDMKIAMKARDDVRVQCLRMVIAACTNELVSKGKKPTDEITEPEVLTVLKRLVKQRKESAEQFDAGGRTEMAGKERQEAAILEAYLPAQMGREEVLKAALEQKQTLGITDASGAGKLTGAIMKALAGKADGAIVKEVVASLF